MKRPFVHEFEFEFEFEFESVQFEFGFESKCPSVVVFVPPL